LLDDVSQLVSNQLEPGRRLGGESRRPEDDLATDCIGMRVYCASRLGGETVGMNTHSTEVVPEARLDDGTSRRVERTPGRAQGAINHRWCSHRL
jgi:hypothetical protein